MKTPIDPTYKRFSKWTPAEIRDLKAEECTELWCRVIWQALRDAKRPLTKKTKTDLKLETLKAKEWLESVDYYQLLALTNINPRLLKKEKKL